MVRASQRFSKVDRNQTAKNADEVLCQYAHHKAMASRWSVALQSPAMTGMPRVESVDNAAENKIVGHLDDKQFVAQVDYILKEGMPMTAHNEDWPRLLTLLYIRGLEPQYVQEQLGLEHSAFYEMRRDALCCFAEWWPPFPSELVVMKHE
jgi:hypothetical protein